MQLTKCYTFVTSPVPSDPFIKHLSAYSPTSVGRFQKISYLRNTQLIPLLKIVADFRKESHACDSPTWGMPREGRLFLAISVSLVQACHTQTPGFYQRDPKVVSLQ